MTPSEDIADVQMHVIFVHGLRGDKEKTWRSSSKAAVFWPRWLERDLPGVATWSIGYTAPATRWRSSAMYLPDAAENVLARLVSEPRLANGTIAFVAHSLGGLVVKQLIRSSERDASMDPRRASLLERVRKVAFLATPHSGADLAVLGNILRAVARPSEASAGLLRNDPNLRDLNRWYRVYASEHSIETLVLQESHRTRFLGQIVKQDSADPGLPGAIIIPIEADHEAISKPADRSSEIYVHVRDFLAQPNPKAHTRGQTAAALSQLKAAVVAGNERVIGGIKEALRERDNNFQGASPRLADAEAAKRLSDLRRSRFFVGIDASAQARQLADEVATGELSSASVAVKVETLAWCARLLAQQSTAEAEAILGAAMMARDTDEVRVARAFVTAARGNHPAALAELSGMTAGLARTASLVVVTWERSVDDSIRWFHEALRSIEELDSDGKFLLLQHYIKTARWDEALNGANSLSQEEFVRTPALFQTAALAHLVQAVPLELRPLILQQAAFDARNFPLAADEESLGHRRQAQDLFTKGAEAASALRCHVAANVSADRALWLGLRDPDGQGEAHKLLERSMSDSAHALRRLPLALQFGLKLDLAAVEGELDRESALSGGKSMDAAVARLAMAMAKGSEGEAADYIARHKGQLIEYYDAGAIAAIEIEMLARSGRPVDAEARLTELERDAPDEERAAKLRRIIAEARGADPVEERIRGYRGSDEISDLLNLVHLLEETRDWKRLAEFGGALFERTRELSHAELLVRALAEEQDDERLLQLFDRYPEILAQSDRLAGPFSWALYRLGKLGEATKLLGDLRAKRDDPNDRALLVNIAIASGEWTSLLAHIEGEWERRAHRTAEEIVGTAQLALHVGSGRIGDLLREAVAKAPDNPAVLMTCYSIATSAGLDENSEVSSWMQRAAALSGEDGPVQKISLHELMARQPDWQRRETETWSRLTEGRLPLFGAAHLLNRSLADLYLRTALTNASQGDVRRRGVILSYSGARPPAEGDHDHKAIALDPSALLTLGLLGLTEKVLRAFTCVLIPHSTLGWILDERQRVRFHQPSRVKEARELQLLLGRQALQPFEPTTKPNSELAAEVGDDLAAMIAEAGAELEGGRQRIVVRPSPVFRLGSLMEEPANLSSHQKVLCGCLQIVEALKRLGQLTAAEEAHARAYLKLNEQPWPHEARVEQGAILYLDDLAVAYLHHLGLLPKLAAAQFVPILSQSRIEEAQTLLLYESVAEQAGSILDETRHCLAEGIKSGLVRLGRISPHDDAEPQLRHHPSMGILSLASEADALVVDDRAFNRHFKVDSGSALRPILTTLDLLQIMHARGIVGGSELAEFRANLRMAGLALIPVQSAELVSLLAACPVNDRVISETAELRSIREGVLGIRMTDILQLPQEHPWLESLLRAWIHALKAQWLDGAEEEAAAARSDWLLDLVDLRAWSHRYPAGPLGLWEERCRAQMLGLVTIAHDKPEPVRSAYWRWLEKAVIADVRNRDPDTFAWLVGQMRDHIDEMVDELVVRRSLVSSEQEQLRRIPAAESLRLFPPFVRQALLEDPDFRNRHAIHTDATITFGSSGLSFKRNAFLSAVRAVLGGAADTAVTALNGTKWRVGAEATEGGRVVTLMQDSERIPLPGLLILSPDRDERLSEFERDAAAAGLDDSAIAEWRAKLGDAPAADEEVECIRSEVQNSPLRIASAISEELESGESSIAVLAPREPRYYERLVGAWGGQGSLSEFVNTSGAEHIRKLIASNPPQGLKLALLMSAHQSISEVIAGERLPLGAILEVFEQLTQSGDRFSQVGAIEIGLALLAEHPELETYLPPLVRQIIADDPAVDGPLSLLSSLIVLVGGEIAKGRMLAARPPYWRQLAAISQAALIERELVTAGAAQADSSFLEWMIQGRGQYFFLQAMVDVRQEPRWLPDFLRPQQLKAEFLGRLVGAAEKYKENIRSGELRTLLLGEEQGSMKSLLRFPFAFLPGPLEGGVEASSDMPEEIRAAVLEQLAAETLKLDSFAALVNSALVFKIGPDHADLAASALRRAKHQIRGGESTELHFSLLSGLATVAAVTRSGELANEIRILTRAARRRLDISTEDAMRIGLIAAAAFPDKDEWSKVVGDWITELAFEDQDAESAAKLLSHIRVLCHVEPELWRTCARGAAALTSIAA